MIKTDKPIIVEGKYDVIKLSRIVDTLIIKTDGFGIFKDKEKQLLLRRLAGEKGGILGTFVASNKSAVPEYTDALELSING